MLSRMPIPLLPFGRTGHMSTRMIFGGAALSRVSQDVADQALEVLLKHDINHIDAARSYGDAELRIAPWLKRYPDRFFLATKTGKRRADEAREELQQSLDRLGVDHVDLWQLHNLSDPIEWDTALSPGGVIDAAVETIKSMAYRPWMGRPRSASTWYEPLEDPSDIQQALDWALGRPGIFVISSGDVNLLPKILEAAERASNERPSDAEMERMVERLQMEPLFV